MIGKTLGEGSSAVVGAPTHPGRNDLPVAQVEPLWARRSKKEGAIAAARYGARRCLEGKSFQPPEDAWRRDRTRAGSRDVLFPIPSLPLEDSKRSGEQTTEDGEREPEPVE